LKTIQERFWAKVATPVGIGECWSWTSYCHRRTGYAIFGINSQTGVPAHRFAYEQLNGPIQKDMVIDHLCRNRSCVNPYHMEVVTQKKTFAVQYYAWINFVPDCN